MISSNIVNQVISVTSIQQVKNLELKEGQVFKGSVVKILPNDMAVVQIGGVNVTAKLEIPLQLAQKKWLQVQEGSNPITLKMISNGTPQNSADAVSSIDDLLHELGIKPTKENAETAQKMIKEQLPLTPKMMDEITSLKTSIGKSDGIVESMAYLMKKGIPVTQQSLQSVREFAFGNGVSSTIEEVVNGLTNYLGPSSGALGALEENSQGREQQSLQNDISRSLIQNGKIPLNQQSNEPIALNQKDQLKDLMIKNPLGNKVIGNDQETNPEPSSVTNSNAQIQRTPRELGEKLLNLLKEISDAYKKNVQEDIPLNKEPIIKSAQEQNPNQPETDQVQNQFTAKGENIVNIFKKLGISHEQNLLSVLIDKFQGVEDSNPLSDNVKSLLLELKNHGDMIPKQLSESMETMLHHITGQQLMMSPDHSPSTFQQIAFQIPLPNSQQNALIQVESRKGGKGSIDPENCRLFFYLDMTFLGPTMVDVNVIDKVMNVTIQNNHSGIGEVIQSQKQELANSLSNIGYHLSSLKVTEMSSKSAFSKDGIQKNAYSSYSNYQGMDIRI